LTVRAVERAYRQACKERDQAIARGQRRASALQRRVKALESTVARDAAEAIVRWENNMQLMDRVDHENVALRNARATLRMLARGGLEGVSEAGCMFCLAATERTMHEDREAHVEGCPIAARLAELDAILGVQAEAQGEPEEVTP